MRRISPGRGVGSRKIVDVANAVDLRGLRGHARLPQQIGFCRRPFDQHVDFLADHVAIPALRDAALQAISFRLRL